jgi:hypothetical protein
VPVYGILIMWMATDLIMTLIIVSIMPYLSCKEKPRIIRTRKEIFPFPSAKGWYSSNIFRGTV